MTDDDKKEAAEQFEFLKYVVSEEDYATGISLQKNLTFGAMDHVLFGKNERKRAMLEPEPQLKLVSTLSHDQLDLNCGYATSDVDECRI